MNRYQWQSPPSNQPRHQLFDSVTGKAIIEIVETNLGWKWERKTNYLLHRSHPAAGTERTLSEAQWAATRDLPLEG